MKKITQITESLDPFFDKISKLSKAQRIIIAVLILAVMIGPCVYWLYLPKHKQIKKLTGEYESLTVKLNDAKKRARQLPKYEAMMKKVKAEFEIAQTALPKTDEIPSLLTSISHAGQDSDLEFVLFKPEKERNVGLHAEIPVSIEVIGGYHDVALFYSKVAQLSRIVNVRDITMGSGSGKKRKGAAPGESANDLTVACTAVTYKFVETSAAPEE